MEKKSPTRSSTFQRDKIVEKAIAIVAVLIIWQLAAMFVGQSLLLVSPLVVIQRLFKLIVEQYFWSAVLYSLLRIAAGFFLALFAGVILGVVAGHVRLVKVLLWPYMAAVKAAPVASFVILVLIWTGASSLSVVISFLIVLPIIYTNVLHGIKSTDVQLLEMAKVFQMGRFRRLYYIHIPHLKSYLLSASTVSIGLAWKAGVAAEVIGIPSGSIGEKLYEAKVFLSSADLFAWTVVVIVISVFFEKFFSSGLKLIFNKMERV